MAIWSKLWFDQHYPQAIFEQICISRYLEYHKNAAKYIDMVLTVLPKYMNFSETGLMEIKETHKQQ